MFEGGRAAGRAKREHRNTKAILACETSPAPLHHTPTIAHHPYHPRTQLKPSTLNPRPPPSLSRTHNCRRQVRGQYMLCHPCADVAFAFFARDVGAVTVEVKCMHGMWPEYFAMHASAFLPACAAAQPRPRIQCAAPATFHYVQVPPGDQWRVEGGRCGSWVKWELWVVLCSLFLDRRFGLFLDRRFGLFLDRRFGLHFADSQQLCIPAPATLNPNPQP